LQRLATSSTETTSTKQPHPLQSRRVLFEKVLVLYHGRYGNFFTSAAAFVAFSNSDTTHFFNESVPLGQSVIDYAEQQ